MTARLSPQRETETASLRSQIADMLWWSVPSSDDAEAKAIAGDLLDKLIAAVRAETAAELAAVRAERDEARTELAKYVGQEPTVVEEMAYLNRCLDAVYALCDEAGAKGITSGGTFTVDAVRDAADGIRPDDPKDRRRRIYIDGNGDAWLSLSHDKGIRYIGRLAGAIPADDTVDSVREATGSLREIGRCW